MRIKIIAAALVCLTSVALAQPFGRGTSGQFPITQSVVSTFELTAPTSATLPVTVGAAFAEGAIPSSGSTDAANSQFVVLNRHSDGSVKTAQITVRDTFTSGVPLTVTVYDTPESGGTDLTPADIDAAAPTASIAFASCTTNTAAACTWTASLLSIDLTAPDEIWAQGPEMVEAIYRQESGKFHVEWHVRLYADDRVRVRALVSYGSIGVDTLAVGDRPSATYTPTVSVGGVTVWNNGGVPYTQYTFSGWDQVAWIGGDPAVDYAPDVDQLYASRVVSSYWQDTPSESVLNALTVTYTPGANLSWPAIMGGTGFDDSIGRLPKWAAMCLTSGGDSRACNSEKAHGRAILGYPVNFVAADGAPMRLTDFPTWGPEGPGTDGGNGLGNGGPLYWETAHNPQPALVAYLITGDPIYYRSVINSAAACWMAQGNGTGSGTSRTITVQTRTRAWCLRNFSDVVAVARTGDSIAAEYKDLLTYQVSVYATEIAAPGANDLGIFFNYNGDGGTPEGRARIQVFMHYFMAMSLGQVDRQDTVADETNLHAVMDHYFPFVLAMGGPGGVGGYCYNVAAQYVIVPVDSVSAYGDTTVWEDSWDTVYQWTCASVGTCEVYPACSNTLRGSSGAAPASADSGYWGNYRAALNAVIEYPPTTAAAITVLDRIKNTTNGNLVVNPTAGDNPIWALGERTPGVWRD